jgi:hypothetical protein
MKDKYFSLKDSKKRGGIGMCRSTFLFAGNTTASLRAGGCFTILAFAQIR